MNRARTDTNRKTRTWEFVVLVAVATVAAACQDASTVLERMTVAQQQAADLRIQFTRAADASSRAVMADTDDVSNGFATEARQASEAVEQGTAALAPVLRGLSFSEEVRLLEEFGSRFAAYRELDRNILSLAVENTNVKAQRLSFGAAHQAADRFRDAFRPVSATGDTSAAAALAATAVASVREIEALQAPHIAESDDDAMGRIEAQMATAERTARRALERLDALNPAVSHTAVAAATAALDEFLATNREIVALSRRNTNVRSLALTLGEKRVAAAACEETLQALNTALAQRGFTATR